MYNKGFLPRKAFFLVIQGKQESKDNLQSADDYRRHQEQSRGKKVHLFIFKIQGISTVSGENLLRCLNPDILSMQFI